MDTQQELLDRARGAMPGGVNVSIRRLEPFLVWDRARGSRIYDLDGKEYIDYHAAFGPVILGHGHENLIRKVRDSLDHVDLIGNGVTLQEVQVTEKIVQHVPSADRVLLCNSGSEATLYAIRLGRAVTGRNRIIKFQGCYHGMHDSVCMNLITPAERIGQLDPLSSGILPQVLENTTVLPFNDLAAVEQAFQESPSDIAAIILEPIPHNVGCILPQPGYLEGLREITRAYGALLIFDEVVTGFRHSLGGYQALCGVKPDLTTLSKAIANGFPIAAVCGTRELMERFNTAENGDAFFVGTYNAHPQATAAALATIAELEKPGSYEHLFRLGDRLRRGLTEIMERAGIPHFVTGFGSIFVTYFMEPPVERYEDLLRHDDALQIRYRQAAIQRGVFKVPMALKRGHIGLSHTEEDIDQTLDVCESALKSILAHSA